MNITVHDPAGAGRRVGRDARRAPTRWADFIKRLARVSEISSAAAAPQGLGAAGGARRGGGAAAEWRHRSRRRARAARQGNGQGRSRHRAASTPSSTTPSSSRARRKRSSKRKRKSATRRQAARSRSPPALEALEGATLEISGAQSAMKIFLAGAGGVIGRRLTPLLRGRRSHRHRHHALGRQGVPPYARSAPSRSWSMCSTPTALTRAVKAAARRRHPSAYRSAERARHAGVCRRRWRATRVCAAKAPAI